MSLYKVKNKLFSCIDMLKPIFLFLDIIALVKIPFHLKKNWRQLKYCFWRYLNNTCLNRVNWQWYRVLILNNWAQKQLRFYCEIWYITFTFFVKEQENIKGLQGYIDHLRTEICKSGQDSLVWWWYF